MCELADHWISEAPSNPIASHQTTIEHGRRVHVLLVDHLHQTLVSLARMLEMCCYKVTMLELPSDAITMLAKGSGEQFDIIMANIHSPDYQGFKLLEEAVRKGIPVILMSSANEDDLLARRALECGASLYIKQPICIAVVKCLWQFVVKEKLRNKLGEDKNEKHSKKESLATTDVSINRKAKRKVVNEDEYSVKSARNGGAHWTKELHAKFMEVVNQLGEGKCYPKEILVRMNVPGLTRMQVASHLQKCRNDKWRPPRERGDETPTSELEKNILRRFGSVPRSCVITYQQQQNQGITSASGIKISVNEEGDTSSTHSLLGLNFSSQNPQMFHGISTGIGNGYTIISSAKVMDSPQMYGPNFPSNHGATASTTNSDQAANLASPRQENDDFFEFPDLDYLMQEVSGLQHRSRTSNHAQSQQNNALEEIMHD